MLKPISFALAAAVALAACQPSGGAARPDTVGATRDAPIRGQLSNGGRTGISRAASPGEALAMASAQRRAKGLGALRADRRLQRAAQDHADWMARNGVMSHSGEGGTRFTHRVARAGYRACFGAENVAYGQRDAQSVIRAWMQSPGHRRNILHAHGRDAAIAKSVDGVGQTYWAMLVAKPC